jgi:hypothetical protein
MEEPCLCSKVVDPQGSLVCQQCQQIMQPLMPHLRSKLALEREVSDLTEKLKLAETAVQTLAQQNRTLSAQLEQRTSDLLSVQRDLQSMGEKLVKEVERRAELQHNKEASQLELEELTKSLFEQANGLVADEARKRHAAEKKASQLSSELESLRQQSKMDHEQLVLLRDQLKDAHFSTMDLSERPKLPMPTIEEASLTEFVKFLDEFAFAPRPMSIPFYKMMVEEDIDLCLKFGGNPRTSTRKLLDAILQNTCYIQAVPESETRHLAAHGENGRSPSVKIPPTFSIFNRTLGERISKLSFVNATVTMSFNVAMLELGQCSTCGKETDCTHQFRVTALPDDEWFPLCTECRDRLKAVCEFYAFIRKKVVPCGRVPDTLEELSPHPVRNKVTVTLTPETVVELYLEMVQLRKKMLYARLGAAGAWQLLDEMGVHGHAQHFLKSVDFGDVLSAIPLPSPPLVTESPDLQMIQMSPVIVNQEEEEAARQARMTLEELEQDAKNRPDIDESRPSVKVIISTFETAEKKHKQGEGRSSVKKPDQPPTEETVNDEDP